MIGTVWYRSKNWGYKSEEIEGRVRAAEETMWSRTQIESEEENICSCVKTEYENYKWWDPYIYPSSGRKLGWFSFGVYHNFLHCSKWPNYHWEAGKGCK